MTKVKDWSNCVETKLVTGNLSSLGERNASIIIIIGIISGRAALKEIYNHGRSVELDPDSL